MIRVAIVEDEAEDASRLLRMLDRYTGEQGEQFQTEVFPGPNEFLDLEGAGFDLIFMDIEMPGINGMETARQLRKADPDVVLIFVTNMAQYALQGYDVGALDFILKPLNYYSFAMKLKKAVRNIRRLNGAILTLKTADGFVRLASALVLYVEVQGHKLTYYTESETYMVRSSMKAAEEELLPLHFLRCNSCYLVNPRHITALQGNTVIVGGTPLQISRARKTEFVAALSNYLGGGAR